MEFGDCFCQSLFVCCVNHLFKKKDTDTLVYSGLITLGRHDLIQLLLVINDTIPINTIALIIKDSICIEQPSQLKSNGL